MSERQIEWHEFATVDTESDARERAAWLLFRCGTPVLVRPMIGRLF